MKRLLLLSTLLVVGLTLAFVAGCSDDDTVAGSDQKTVGNTNDPVLDIIGAPFEFSQEFSIDMITKLFDVIDAVANDNGNPGMPGFDNRNLGSSALADSMMLTYHSDTKYWYYYFSASDTFYVEQEDGSDLPVAMNMVIIDSVQFIHGTTIVQWPDSALLTSVKMGISIQMTADDQSMNVQGGQILTLTGDLGGGTELLVNGTQELETSLNIGMMLCSFSTDMSATFTDLVLDDAVFNGTGCPPSGIASYTGSISVSCEGDTTFTFSQAWAVTQTFAGDSMHVVVENNTTRWEFDEACDDVPASPFKSGFAINEPRK